MKNIINKIQKLNLLQCGGCKGTGYIVDDPNDYVETCPTCTGTGHQNIGDVVIDIIYYLSSSKVMDCNCYYPTGLSASDVLISRALIKLIALADVQNIKINPYGEDTHFCGEELNEPQTVNKIIHQLTSVKCENLDSAFARVLVYCKQQNIDIWKLVEEELK